MSRSTDILLTAAAPAIWGSTYIVTTELLPAGYPLTVAMLRALPAGLLLLLVVRQLPQGIWWGRTFLLGALFFEPALPVPTAENLAGFLYLGIIGAALTYIVWFRGLARLDPATISPLGFLSPLVAVVLGWALLRQDLSLLQIAGMVVVLGSVWLSQWAQAQGTARISPRPAPPAGVRPSAP